MRIHLKLVRPPSLLLLVSVLAGGPLVNPADAGAQDVRELQRRLELTEAKVAEEARSTEVRLATAHRQIAALEEEREGLRRELGELASRFAELEAFVREPVLATPAPGGAASPEEETRGFRQVGSAWRFEAGGSFLEIDASGIRIQSGGNLALTSGQNVTVHAPSNLELSSGGSWAAVGGAGMGLQAGTSLSATAGTNLSASAGAEMTFQAASTLTATAGVHALVQGGGMASVFGGVVRLGGTNQLVPVAHQGSATSSNSVLTGKHNVLVGGN